METRLLARLLSSARTVTALGAVAASRETNAEQPDVVRAQVAARLSDGAFRVMVDGRSLRVELPANTRPGDIVELRVVGRETAPADPSDAKASSADSTLSRAGRLLSSLLSDAPPGALRQARPILQLPPSTPADLPEPLARAVERSGFFYESHQARWAGGDFPLERLLEEPQAALAQLRGSPAQAPGPELPHANGAAPAAASPALTPVDQTDAGSTRSSEESSATNAQDRVADAVAREAVPIVRQQLDALDSRQVTWLGEIWPGQSMRWEIGEEPASTRETGEMPGWDTAFALALPGLGDIGARLHLRAGALHVALTARTDSTAALMQSAAQELARALAVVGVIGPTVKVSHGEPSV